MLVCRQKSGAITKVERIVFEQFEWTWKFYAKTPEKQSIGICPNFTSSSATCIVGFRMTRGSYFVIHDQPNLNGVYHSRLSESEQQTFLMKASICTFATAIIHMKSQYTKTTKDLLEIPTLRCIWMHNKIISNSTANN